MAKPAALAQTRIPQPADLLRAALVWSCALSLILAGRAFPL